MIDCAKVKAILPCNVYAELEGVCTKYKIVTPLRLAHFLAQCDHESGHFTRVSENLNYSLEALLRVFPKYFNIDSDVEKYVHKPADIAARVYANRMGNGDEESRDGWDYRGRGYIQLTGRDNYEAFSAIVNDNLTAYPDLVASRYPLESAAWFWNSRKLNDLADTGSDQQVVAEITKKINGGYHGLENRQKCFYKYFAALS